MNEIAKQLREYAATSAVVIHPNPRERDGILDAAADEIERLQAIVDAPRVVGIPAEPTPAMIEAGEALVPWSPGTESRRGFPEPAAIYRAMVAAASPSEERKQNPLGLKLSLTCCKCDQPATIHGGRSYCRDHDPDMGVSI